MVHVGIAPHMLVFDLAQTAVYDAIRLRRENWMLAHETLLEYLQKIHALPNRLCDGGHIFERRSIRTMYNATPTCQTRGIEPEVEPVGQTFLNKLCMHVMYIATRNSPPHTWYETVEHNRTARECASPLLLHHALQSLEVGKARLKAWWA